MTDTSPAVPTAPTSEERWNTPIARGAAPGARLRRRWLVALPTVCLVIALLILVLSGRL
jgi:hypothetical protein